ncbi:flagellar hook-basal body complex protein FliE [Pseudoruegeria sp. HB172150]|uniref:flagellar hook-basal body complex protein FliE n=1 Tax=Pseudoruegeria sp. HB172150 TaxID=2721164 RepID=UPI001556D2C2|nr:flagellar hook-basal body complex protein FliE [Pseudoruegeria sp. HB172150]
MDIRSYLATHGYAATRPATAPKPLPDGPSAGTEFGALAEDFATTIHKGEEAAKSVLTGGADPHALVQALAQTELAVETAVTVRDKVVEAYQEILRMPV